MTVNRDNVRKWVDALRSGDFKQTQGTLRHTDSAGENPAYCCLGVACAVSGLGEFNELDQFKYVDAFGGTRVESAVLPPAVREWLGIDTDNPELGPVPFDDRDEPEEMSCISANDDFHQTFEQIADLVEHHYLYDEPAEPKLIGI